MRGWGLPWLFLGLAGHTLDPGAVEPLRIQADALLAGTLVSGETQRYSLPLAAGDYARLEVLQQGLDLAASVHTPSGSPVVDVDTPTGRYSTEIVSLIAEEPGDYRIEIRAVFPAESGSYTLALTARRPADRNDRLRVEAERADLEAGHCVRQGCPEGIAAARRAIERWHTLGDGWQEGRSLAQLGQVLGASGQTAEALASYEQALALQRKLGDREGLAETLNQVGRARRLLGDEKAFQAFEESIALWQELGRFERATAVLLNLGTAWERFGDTDAALAAYQRALAASRQASDRRREAMALNSIGQIHISLGQPLAALEELREALRLSRSVGRRTTEAQVLSNLGSLHRNLGMPHEALEHFAAAREIFRDLGDSEKEAAALNNLGILLFQLGALDEAHELLLQALPERRAPSDQAMTLVGLSWVAEALGDTREAAERLEAALKLQRQVGDRAGEAETLRAQGVLLASSGDPARAEDVLREALDIFEELGRPSGVAAVRRGLARVYAARGELDMARSSYEEARRQSEALGDIGAEALTLAEQGRLEHEKGTLAAARERLEAALRLMESFRSEVGGDRLRALHFATVRETYERYADVLMQLHREDPKAGLDLKAFEAAEQSRSRGLLDVLARARVDLREGDPKLLERELALRQELSAKALLRMDLADGPATAARSRELLEKIESLTAEHRIVEALLTGGSGYAGLRKPSLSLEEIQALLDRDTVLLEYLLGDRRSYLWIVSSGALRTFELPGRTDLGPLARRLHEHLRDPGEREVAGQRKDLKLLSQLILGPAEEAIAGKRLVIVADGPLQYVPFAALPVRSSAGDQPLLVQHEIVMLPSAAVLKEIRRAGAGRPRGSPSLAIVADPVYRDAGGLAHQKIAASRTSSMQELPWSRREAEQIAAVAHGREVLVALGSDATRELVTSGRLDRFQVLHFATHGILDGEHPELSGLAFSQVDASGRSVDGFLRLQDLYSLHLQADLVVLSGCETGLGRELRGEGLIGLTHGFLHAGASQVVASLWPVRDRAAADLMQRFYRSMLRDGLAPAAALRAAQIEMLSQRAWRDPYFWAAFVAQGDWMAGGASLHADTADTR